MMSRKKIGVLALILITGIGFLDINAGRRMPQVRMADVEAANVRKMVLAMMRKALFSGLPNDQILAIIAEQVNLLGKSPEEINRIVAIKEADAAAKVKAAADAEAELQRAKEALAANNTPENQQAVEQASNKWSWAKIAAVSAAAIAGTAVVVYGVSKGIDPATDDSGYLRQAVTGFGTKVDEIRKGLSDWWNTPTTSATGEKKKGWFEGWSLPWSKKTPGATQEDLIRAYETGLSPADIMKYREALAPDATQEDLIRAYEAGLPAADIMKYRKEAEAKAAAGAKQT